MQKSMISRCLKAGKSPCNRWSGKSGLWGFRSYIRSSHFRMSFSNEGVGAVRMDTKSGLDISVTSTERRQCICFDKVLRKGASNRVSTYLMAMVSGAPLDRLTISLAMPAVVNRMLDHSSALFNATALQWRQTCTILTRSALLFFWDASGTCITMAEWRANM
jgi:hypothetical protein